MQKIVRVANYKSLGPSLQKAKPVGCVSSANKWCNMIRRAGWALLWNMKSYLQSQALRIASSFKKGLCPLQIVYTVTHCENGIRADMFAYLSRTQTCALWSMTLWAFIDQASAAGVSRREHCQLTPGRRGIIIRDCRVSTLMS